MNLKKLILIGVAYKKNTSDTRGSPSIDIIKKFLKKKFSVKYYDPHVKKVDLKNKYFNNSSLSFTSTKKQSSSSIVIIGTDHLNVNYKSILKSAKIVFDTRGVLKDNKSKKIIFV